MSPVKAALLIAPLLVAAALVFSIYSRSAPREGYGEFNVSYVGEEKGDVPVKTPETPVVVAASDPGPPSLAAQTYLANREVYEPLNGRGITAFNFLEEGKLEAVTESGVVPGSYAFFGEDIINLSIPDEGGVVEMAFAYSAQQQTLRGRSGSIYDLRGGRADLEHQVSQQQRQQANTVVNHAKVYEAAIDQWAIEWNRPATTTFQFSNVSDYIKNTHHLVRTQGQDILGNPYTTGTVADGVKVHKETHRELESAMEHDFWGNYAPK